MIRLICVIIAGHHQAKFCGRNGCHGQFTEPAAHDSHSRAPCVGMFVLHWLVRIWSPCCRFSRSGMDSALRSESVSQICHNLKPSTMVCFLGHASGMKECNNYFFLLLYWKRWRRKEWNSLFQISFATFERPTFCESYLSILPNYFSWSLLDVQKNSRGQFLERQQLNMLFLTNHSRKKHDNISVFPLQQLSQKLCLVKVALF